MLNSLLLPILSLTFSLTFLPSKHHTLPPTTQGQWTLLHSSIGISAMHMQLLHDNKVIIYDRTDFGQSNISLPNNNCRYDQSDTVLKIDCTAHSILYDITTNQFRPLTVQTDTWCSSGAPLPDGTLIQTGGYNDGDHVLRTFTTCIDNSCDWIEFPNYLTQRRWYSTNQILPNGDIIIIGGRRQYNYEFYPKTSVFDFDFLLNTRDKSENNLYPFVHLLPDGNLFIFANTKSILLDYKNNRVVREYPEIEGGDPRNYPSSGSSVMLPLDENREGGGGVEVEIMVCGGARKEAFGMARNEGVFLRAASSCGRLVVAGNGSWVMEEMPFPRVMGDMLILPTGDVIVVNGGGAGTAGWELGRDPVMNPVIYSPALRQGERFSIMAASSRPRMYHSSAILLTDGRILVGGNNPHIYYNFTNVLYPTDLSLETFSPPYLSSQYNFLRPTITEMCGKIGYNWYFNVSFMVPVYKSMSETSIRIIFPSFTTHSFSMSQRMVVLRIRGVYYKNGIYTAEGIGPSSAEIAPPGYYMLFVVHSGVPSFEGKWVKIE